MNAIGDQGPVEILCKEIGFPFSTKMENERLFVEFVRKIVDEVDDMRELGDRLRGVTGAGPSDGSATVLQTARSMLASPRHRMIDAAAEVHRLARELNPEDAYPTDHLIDMLSSCASAIRFGLEKPCHSRHAAEAANHVWQHRYGISLFDRFTSNWQKDWTRAKMNEAMLSLFLQGERIVDAARYVLDSKTDSFKTGNGRKVGIEDDGGEKCWIVPFDQMAALDAATKGIADK